MKKLRENMKKLRENIYLILAIGLVAIVVGFLTAAWFGCSQDPGTGYEAPSSAHWLGCRGSGADLARYTGAAVVRSVSLAVVVSVAVVFLGFVAGGMWALVGNRSAHGLAWHVMVLGLLGPTPLIVSIGTLFVFPDPGSFIAFVTAIGLGAVGPVALRMREEVSRLANQPWVRIAREEGLGTWATLWQQVWPGARPFLRSLAVLTCIGVVTTDTALGALCAGKNTPSLGRLLEDARQAQGESRGGPAWRFIAASGVSLGLVLASLESLRAWLEDRRVLRGTPQAAEGGITPSGSGWKVTVRHRSTGRVLARGWVPAPFGEVDELKGPSGSGKSLLMQAVCRVLPDDLEEQVDPINIPDGLLTMYVPQAMQESFTGSLDECRAALNVEANNLSQLAKKLGLNQAVLARETMSGGEAARRALALALGTLSPNRPVILLIDEPVAALDNKNLRRVGKVLTKATGQRLGIVIANHRPGLQAFVTRLVFMVRGRPVWAGSPAELAAANTLPSAVEKYRKAVRCLTRRRVVTLSVVKPVIRVQGLTLGYPNEKPVVTRLSFDVGPGEVVALDGKSGSGKSTVLAAVDGHLRPLKGEIFVRPIESEDFGRPRTIGIQAWRRAVRVAHQNPQLTLNPDIPVGRALSQAAVRLGLSKVKESVLDACKQAQFPKGKLHLTPSALSGGLRARAGLAHAFLGAPGILLLDEPTAGLDVEVAVKVLRQIRKFAVGGGAVLIVDHDPAHLAYLGARLVNLHPATGGRKACGGGRS